MKQLNFDANFERCLKRSNKKSARNHANELNRSGSLGDVHRTFTKVEVAEDSPISFTEQNLSPEIRSEKTPFLAKNKFCGSTNEFGVLLSN